MCGQTGAARRDRDRRLQLLISVSVSEIPGAVIANIPADLSAACINAAMIENRNSAILSRPIVRYLVKKLENFYVYARVRGTQASSFDFTARKMARRNNGEREEAEKYLSSLVRASLEL